MSFSSRAGRRSFHHRSPRCLRRSLLHPAGILLLLEGRRHILGKFRGRACQMLEDD